MSTTPPVTEVAKREPPPNRALVTAFGATYNIDPNQVISILANVVLKAAKLEDQPSLEETFAFMTVCNAYKLNPFLKQIFGFKSQGKMLYVVSVDGWATLIAREPDFDGVEFDVHFDDDEKVYAVTAKIHHKRRNLPIAVTEYLVECRRATKPWEQWPIRMLRHKAFIQCARLAFGIGGIMDEDEVDRMDDAPVPRAAKPAADKKRSIVEMLTPAKELERQQPEAEPVAEAAADPTPEPSGADAEAVALMESAGIDPMAQASLLEEYRGNLEGLRAEVNWMVEQREAGAQ